MERRFSNSDFERYVQDNADQYRMFPSEKVWNKVHNALHKRRRWYGLGLAFLLLLTGTAVTFVMRTYPVSKNSNNANTPTSVDRANGRERGSGIQCNTNLQTKVKQIFFDRVFVLEAGEQLIAYLRAHLPAGLALAIIYKRFKSGAHIDSTNQPGNLCVIFVVGRN